MDSWIERLLLIGLGSAYRSIAKGKINFSHNKREYDSSKRISFFRFLYIGRMNSNHIESTNRLRHQITTSFSKEYYPSTFDIKAAQRLSLGGGATILISVFFTGCMKVIDLA